MRPLLRLVDSLLGTDVPAPLDPVCPGCQTALLVRYVDDQITPARCPFCRTFSTWLWDGPVPYLIRSRRAA